MTTHIAVLPGTRLGRSRPDAARRTTEEPVTDINLGTSGLGGPSLGDFAREHGLELTRFAYLISGDRTRADDLVQDVLLAMHRRFGARLALDQPVAYARRAIVNANISFNRRRSSTEVLTATDLDRPVTDDPGPDDLWSLLAGLPHRQRVVLVMRYYLGYSDAEIAGTLGCRRGTVRSLASRALAELRTSDGITLLSPPGRSSDDPPGSPSDSPSHDGTNR
jgi:RNA polymerase sigma factor (sigma-70 family)